MSHSITTITELENCIGKTSGPKDLKVIDHLDEHALRWISVSTCMFVSLADTQGEVFATIGGGAPGFVRTGATHLKIPLNLLDHPESLQPGKGWGALFLVPTLKESLRVNGVIESVEEDTAIVKVMECYLHCAKAFMRSNFWQPTTCVDSVDAPEAFFALTNFMLVASSDKFGQADMSPKGDPAEKLLFEYDQSVWYAERPGNRRADGHRNVLSQPKIAVLAIIPGYTKILRLSGSAQLSTDKDIRKEFTVQNKIPSLVTQVLSQTMEIEESSALKRANLWPAEPPRIELNAAEIFKTHIKLSKIQGTQAELAKTAVTTPGVFEKRLELDYAKNMY